MSTKLATPTPSVMVEGSTSSSQTGPLSLTPMEDAQLVHLVVMTALSLCRLKGSQNLHGLYTWCKERTGKKFRWISPLIDFVKHRVENGINGLQTSLMSSQVLDAPCYGDAATGGAITHLAKEAYHFHMFLHEEMSITTNPMVAYEARSNSYKEQIDQNCFEPHTQEYLEALSTFDNGVVPPIYKDADTSSLSLFRADDIIIHTHQLLLQAASCYQNSHNKLRSWKDSENLTSSLNKSEQQLNSLLTDHRLSKHDLQQVLILKAVHMEVTCLTQRKSGNLGRFLSLVDVRSVRQKLPPTSQLVLIKKWGEFFAKFQHQNPQFYFQLNGLNLEIAAIARKERNYRLAATYLRKTLLLGINSDLTLRDYMKQLDFSASLLSIERAASLRQAAKLVHVLGDGGVLSVQTLSGIATSIYATTYNFRGQHDTTASMREMLQISSRSLNTMARWLKAEPMLLEKVYPDMISSVSDRATVSHVLELEQSSPAPDLQDFLLMPHSVVVGGNCEADADMVIGRLLRLAVIQAPQLAKMWNNLANWSMELGERLLTNCENNLVVLTVEEQRNIFTLLSSYHQGLSYAAEDALQQQYKEVLCLVTRLKIRSSQTDDAGGDAGKCELMKRTLLGVCGPWLREAPTALLDSLQLIWDGVQKRVFFYHETAINAYFQFLSRATDNEEDEKIVSATLRLLQLTVRHALELQECLQKGLVCTPSAQWRAIIPQLFSRLNHPVLIVRNRISELLCRIAQDYPHLIIYPAVVGSVSMAATDKVSKLLTSVVDDEQTEQDIDCKETPAEKETEQNTDEGSSSNSRGSVEVNPEMQSAHANIVEFMMKQSEVGQKSIEQVQVVVYELQRISLLWDELWLGTLQQYGNEINRRVKKMDDEVQRLSRNDTLTQEEKSRLVKEKYNIIFKPVIYVLEKVAAVTCGGETQPATPHEKGFANRYGEFLSETLCKLKEPLTPGKPKEVWGLLHTFQVSLTNRLQKKNQLRLSEISTKLSAIKHSCVPLPGIVSDSTRELVIGTMRKIIYREVSALQDYSTIYSRNVLSFM